MRVSVLYQNGKTMVIPGVVFDPHTSAPFFRLVGNGREVIISSDALLEITEEPRDEVKPEKKGK